VEGGYLKDPKGNSSETSKKCQCSFKQRNRVRQGQKDVEGGVVGCSSKSTAGMVIGWGGCYGALPGRAERGGLRQGMVLVGAQGLGKEGGGQCVRGEAKSWWVWGGHTYGSMWGKRDGGTLFRNMSDRGGWGMMKARKVR